MSPEREGYEKLNPKFPCHANNIRRCWEVRQSYILRDAALVAELKRWGDFAALAETAKTELTFEIPAGLCGEDAVSAALTEEELDFVVGGAGRPVVEEEGEDEGNSIVTLGLSNTEQRKILRATWRSLGGKKKGRVTLSRAIPGIEATSTTLGNPNIEVLAAKVRELLQRPVDHDGAAIDDAMEQDVEGDGEDSSEGSAAAGGGQTAATARGDRVRRRQEEARLGDSSRRRMYGES